MSKFSRLHLDRVRDAIADLPEPVRTAYMLHLRERLDYGSIAERLQLTVPQVEQQIAEALVRIDRALRRPGDAGGR